jgi:sec-independent protein translocase protein TatB
MLDISLGELLLILLIAMVFLGPDRIPVAARKIGEFMRMIKDAFMHVKEEVTKDEEAAKVFNEMQETVQTIANAVNVKKGLRELAVPLMAPVNIKTLREPQGPGDKDREKALREPQGPGEKEKALREPQGPGEKEKALREPQGPGDKELDIAFDLNADSSSASKMRKHVATGVNPCTPTDIPRAMSTDRQRTDKNVDVEADTEAGAVLEPSENHKSYKIDKNFRKIK